MDQMVLAAQHWVNQTYKGVTGYVACTEDGVTGWETMHSLTRALQRELGLTSLADAFGPATLAALQARGGVKYGESGNIVKIVQCACYCKGYSPGSIDGQYAFNTEFAITSMMTDAGIRSRYSNAIEPKVMKALLSMDAYVLLSGGDTKTRSAQQWLNSRYLSRLNFFVMPCDGLFSRDVQKYLLYAIQYELGMSDAVANGYFGDQTRAGVASKVIAVGSSGTWVGLFTAAMVFNGVGSFTIGSFTSALGSALSAFQEFACLTKSGKGDFATWAQLLVSTGDPDRAGTGADCITTITDARAKALYAANYRTVGRYLTNGPTLDKNIKAGELATIFANRLRVVPIYQYSADARSYFTESRGYADAVLAHDAATGYGFNQGTVIFFGVDYDATDDDIEHYVLPYFRGVVRGLMTKGRKYFHGVYGTRNVCQRVSSETRALWSFVGDISTGYSGNMGFALPQNWCLNQIQTKNVGTGTGLVNIDKDVIRPNTYDGVAAVNTPSSATAEFLTYLSDIYALARAYGKGNPSELVLQALRYVQYNSVQWQALIGGVDDSFIAKFQQSGITVINELQDPGYGVGLKVAHFGATCNAVLLKGQARVVAANASDVAGWAGDLFTFYGEWQSQVGSYASGAEFCAAKLMKANVDSTMKLRDVIEDADGFNVGMAVKAGKDIVTAMNENLTAGYKTRFTRYYTDRFFGTTDGLRAALQGALRTSAASADVVVAREWLCRQTGGVDVWTPDLLPEYKYTPFETGVMTALTDLVAQEK